MTPAPWHIMAALAGLAAAAATVAWRSPAGRRWPLWLALTSVASFAVNGALAVHAGIPEPRVQDEFSYLLASDTFAHGRLTNPTPPAWGALQSFHVLLRPTYASKYPPGQGLALALGQATVGLPIVGAWLATAALAMAAGWAAAAFVPGPWAVVAAATVAFHPQVVEWSQTYWGGSVAALGGALVLGGWARLASPGRPGARTPWAIDAAAVGLGLGVLAITRPYEGLAAAGAPLAHIVIRRPRAGAAVLIAALPLLTFSCLYDARVTGSPWRLPYLEYESQYAAAPPLLVEAERPVPADAPPAMRAYAERVELPHFRAQRSFRGFVAGAAGKLAFLAGATFPSPWLWPLAALVPWAVAGERRLRVAAAVVGATLTATLLANWTRSQYVAPATAAVAVLLAAAAHRSAITFPRVGRGAGAAALVGTALLPFGPAPPGPHFQRAQLATALRAEPGRQLVLVRYDPDHRSDDEWVYNDADPPSSKVVWARDDGTMPTTAVRAAYPGRTVWHVDVGPAAAVVRQD
jgi:hypothetical protein